MVSIYFNSKKLYLLGCYVLSVALFLNSQSMFMYWVFLEINLVLYILILSETNPSFNFEECLYYLVVQSLGSFLFLLGSIYMMDNNLYNLTVSVSLLGVLIKLGVYPFHSWVFKLSGKMSNFPFLVLNTGQKIPLFLIIFTFGSSILIWVLFFNLVMGSLYLFYCSDYKQLVISSSLYITIWFYLSFTFSPVLFFLTFTLYSLFLWKFLEVLSEGNSMFPKSFILLFCAAFFMGLPPFNIFFMKMYLFSLLSSMTPNLGLALIWMFSLSALVGYSKYFWNKFLFYNVNFMLPVTKPFSALGAVFLMSSISFFL